MCLLHSEFETSESLKFKQILLVITSPDAPIESILVSVHDIQFESDQSHSLGAENCGQTDGHHKISFLSKITGVQFPAEAVLSFIPFATASKLALELTQASSPMSTVSKAAGA
jgi:hypothetical protein